MRIPNGIPSPLQKERAQNPRVRLPQPLLHGLALGREVAPEGRVAAQHDLKRRARLLRRGAQVRDDLGDERMRVRRVQRARVGQDEEAAARRRGAEFRGQRCDVPDREDGDVVAGLGAGGVVVESDEDGDSGLFEKGAGLFAEMSWWRWWER